MHRRWLALAALLAAAPARADEALSAPYAAMASGAREEGAVLAEKVAAHARRPVARIISWNVQAFGGNISPEREATFGDVLGAMLDETRTARILSFQEIANATGDAKIGGKLPGGGERWKHSFVNSDSAMDNGFYSEKSVGVECDRPLFAAQDADGRWRRDRETMMHPPHAAHMRVGDFDFTLVSVHLTFGGADRAGTARELGNLLDWLARYLATPGSDPDVIITGDFNLPTRKGHTDERGPSLEDVIEAHKIFGQAKAGQPAPPWGLVATVDSPTSRSNGQPSHNYDHFIMTGDAYNEEYVMGSAGGVPPGFVQAIEASHGGEQVSDHFPVSAGFYTAGLGNDGRPIAPDGDGACRVLLAMAPLAP